MRTTDMDYRFRELEQLHSGVSVGPESIVLDALCGDGFASKQFIGKAGKIIGVDNKAKPGGFPNEFEYSRQAVQSLDFADGTFSLVLAHTGFHHVGQGDPMEQQQAVNEFYRVLQPAGMLRLADLEGHSSASRLNDDLVPNHMEHCVWLTPGYAASLLNSAGFAEVKARSVCIHWEFVVRSQLEEVAGSVFRADIRTLEEYGLIKDLTIRLPFVYAGGVKK